MGFWGLLWRLWVGERGRAEQVPQPRMVAAVAHDASIVPVCPACGAQLPKVPQRKTRCKACGKFMFVRSTPDDRTRRLVTAEQAARADAAWSEKADADRSVREGAIYGLPSLPKDPAVRRAYCLMHTDEQLAKLASKGFRSAQIAGGNAIGCDACLRMNGVIVPTTANATDVVPSDCARLGQGRATCSLYVSGWIKRPDGTGYVDRVK